MPPAEDASERRGGDIDVEAHTKGNLLEEALDGRRERDAVDGRHKAHNLVKPAPRRSRTLHKISPEPVDTYLTTVVRQGLDNSGMRVIQGLDNSDMRV